MDRPKTWLIEQAVRHYVEEQSWQVQAIQEALEELDSGFQRGDELHLE